MLIYLFVFSSLTSELFGGAENTFLSQSMHNDFTNTSVAQPNLSMFELNPDEIYDTDGVSKLKAAFIYQLSKNNTKCTEILSELLHNDGTNKLATDLDGIVLAIAKDLAEDIPAADPRWEQLKSANKSALGSSNSMQIIQQLKEKKLALNHFVEFLHATDLWEQVSILKF